MRILFVLISCGLAGAQNTPAPVTIDVAPLRPPDLSTAYASPRDAARHRLQRTLADLQSKRDVRAAVRGFADALAGDPTYALAAFDLAIVAAIAERWDDAIAAFEEAARLDAAGMGAPARQQVERLRLVAELEQTPEGKRRRSYDAALLPVLAKLPKMPQAEATAVLAEIGRIDPKRWEAPALLAALHGNGHGYEIAVKFLDIAVTNAADPAVKASLQKARNAADREMRYAAARAEAEVAGDGGNHAKAAELFEAAWTAMPARAANGLEAASELLLQDDTARASVLLVRLQASGDPKLAETAGVMLKHLAPVEPAAKASSADSAQFYRDPGFAEPVRISELLPPIDKANMELLARPLPRLVQDAETVTLLATLSADAVEAQGAALPGLPEPSVTFENAWKDIQTARQRSVPVADVAKPMGDVATIDAAPEVKAARLLKLTSEPSGARAMLDDRLDAVCQTPCDMRVTAGSHTVRIALARYKDEERTVKVDTKITEVAVPLALARGVVIVETPAPATLKVNGTAVNISTPAELALIPGLHVISADFGSGSRERVLMVKPGARLRVQLKP
jgi:tetratricopeptide (TPR) repeat protein